jgi:MOSC domain-containing protein YiiM
MTATETAILQSVQVGRPHRHDNPAASEPGQSTWRTSFFRQPSPAPRWLYTTHLDGNKQADTRNHGRPDQAVLVYAAAHYDAWRAELDRPEMGPGGFAENLTVTGLTEATVCIGDVYAIGAARIQITGPRWPCYKIERRWALPGLTARVAATGRTGWYCGVLQEGLIEPGLPVTLVERPCPDWTVALLNDLGHNRRADRATAAAIAACPALSPWWRDLLARRARGRQT